VWVFRSSASTSAGTRREQGRVSELDRGAGPRQRRGDTCDWGQTSLSHGQPLAPGRPIPWLEACLRRTGLCTRGRRALGNLTGRLPPHLPCSGCPTRALQLACRSSSWPWSLSVLRARQVRRHSATTCTPPAYTAGLPSQAAAQAPAPLPAGMSLRVGIRLLIWKSSGSEQGPEMSVDGSRGVVVIKTHTSVSVDYNAKFCG
jgi:hypothetical protein